MTGRVRRSPRAIWRASSQVLVAAVPPRSPTRVGGSAALVWRHLQEPVTLDELCELVAADAGVPTERVHADVVALIDQLLPLELVEVVG